MRPLGLKYNRPIDWLIDLVSAANPLSRRSLDDKNHILFMSLNICNFPGAQWCDASDLCCSNFADVTLNAAIKRPACWTWSICSRAAPILDLLDIRRLTEAYRFKYSTRWRNKKPFNYAVKDNWYKKRIKTSNCSTVDYSKMGWSLIRLMSMQYTLI